MYIWHDILLRDPLHLLLLLMIPFIILWRRRARSRKGDVGMIFPSDYTKVPQSWRTRLYAALNPLFYVSLGLIIISIARPQKEHVEETVKGEGIDIFLVMDVSSSMLARDFNPDRLSVSKRVAVDFVSRRNYDRIGLAVFAGESYTQCPLTHDHEVLSEYLRNLQCGQLEDGTAIGMGLAAAVNRLKDSEAVSKVVVLLTDGVNNAGYIRPATAADVAKEFGIKVYTIGVGSYGQAMSPVRRRADGEYLFGLTNVEIDEELLTMISEQTGGKYYRAISEESLQRIYDEIDQLEKTMVEITAFKRVEEMYYIPLAAGLVLFGLLFLMRSTVLRTLPY
jgi:Ca-activated chloride channel family protein